MKKIVDAAIVAALLMTSIPEPIPADLPMEPPAAVAESTVPSSHGDRPC